MADWQQLLQSIFIGLIFSYLLAKLISLVVSFKEDNLSITRDRSRNVQGYEKIDDSGPVPSPLLSTQDEGLHKSDSVVAELGSLRNESDGDGLDEDDDDDDWEGVECTELDDAFSAATAFVAAAAADRLSQRVPNEVQLQLYGLYKIATEGPCTAPQPSALKMTARAKWQAWYKLGAMPPEDAMQKYIDIVSELYPTWTDGSAMSKGGADSAASKDPKGPMGPVFSSFIYEEESGNDLKMDAIHTFAREGELDNLLKCIESGVSVHLQDSEGRTPLHWAVDRGHLKITEALVSRDADVNAKDNEGQTPLHYAVVCERKDIAEFLVKQNADKDMKDNDGNSPVDLLDRRELKEPRGLAGELGCYPSNGVILKGDGSYTESLKQFQEQNLPGFLLSLSGELANEEKPVETRKLAGLILKNALDAKEQHRKFELVQRWLSLDDNAKSQIKACLLKTISSPVSDARSTASQVIAKVAGIELPQKQWLELIGSLLSNVHQPLAHAKQATLETLGYLCEEVSPDVIDQDQINKILTAVVQGMSASEGNADVRLAATRALNNALGFAQANFNNDMERDYLMRVVCEATQSSDMRIRQAAFECLVSISSTYYEKLASYIQDIFNVTAKAVREDDESVALQAIEFWSSICDEEIDILEEYEGVFTGDSDITCFYFIKQALPALVPMLLELLLKQEEDQDQDEGAWNIAMAGGTCLGLVARTVGDDIVPLVVPFIEENITKQDWRQREAATYAFGSILEGPSPEKLIPLVNVALNFMLSALTKDPNSHVKDTTAWTLGRIFEFLHGSAIGLPIITQENCVQIVTVLLHSMKDTPNVAEKACGALYFLAQGYEEVGPSSPLTLFFQEIVQSLLTVTHREDAGESRLRTAAYETLNEVVRCSTDETAPLVLQLVPVIMMELHNTLEGQKLPSDGREKQSDLHGLLCGCLQVLIQKLSSSETTKHVFMQYADQIMGLFLRVFACRNATVHEEAMLAIGALAYATGPDFAKYMPEFYRYLEMGLQNFEEYQVCSVAVGVVGDICRALEDKIAPYCDGIMTQLLKNLSSNQLHRSVKPPIFSCFGDIALAVGEYFEKYLTWAMSALQRAAELSTHVAGDDELTEYTNSLRNGILEAYSGIFQGFKNSPKKQILIPYAPHIIQFLDGIYMEKDMDDVVMKTAIGVLGDVADTLGSHVGSLIQQSHSSKDFLNECLSSEDLMIKESAEWAKLAITRAISV
ncbi:hypothetical protein V6N13_027812 [Hibiscus sabdariffa]